MLPICARLNFNLKSNMIPGEITPNSTSNTMDGMAIVKKMVENDVGWFVVRGGINQAKTKEKNIPSNCTVNPTSRSQGPTQPCPVPMTMLTRYSHRHLKDIKLVPKLCGHASRLASLGKIRGEGVRKPWADGQTTFSGLTHFCDAAKVLAA